MSTTTFYDWLRGLKIQYQLMDYQVQRETSLTSCTKQTQFITSMIHMMDDSIEELTYYSCADTYKKEIIHMMTNTTLPKLAQTTVLNTQRFNEELYRLNKMLFQVETELSDLS